MKAILFDMNGVLTDSFNPWWAAFNETLERFGKKKISKREYREKYWGPDEKSILEKFGLGDDALDYLKSRYLSHIKEVRIFPETKKILKSLNKKFKLALVSNTTSELVHKTLEYFDLKKYFDVIVTVDDVKKGKPGPEMIIKACESLDVDRRDVIIVGDTMNDVLAGKSAGCVVVGLNTESDFKIKRLSDLTKFVEQTIKNKD